MGTGEYSCKNPRLSEKCFADLVCVAYDFYSFVKLRILFGDHETGPVKEEKIIPEEDELVLENVEDSELLKQKLTEAYVLIEQAKEEKDKGHYS